MLAYHEVVEKSLVDQLGKWPNGLIMKISLRKNKWTHNESIKRNVSEPLKFVKIMLLLTLHYFIITAIEHILIIRIVVSWVGEWKQEKKFKTFSIFVKKSWQIFLVWKTYFLTNIYISPHKKNPCQMVSMWWFLHSNVHVLVMFTWFSS
jgi:plasmid maintenance system killer protein